MDNDLDSLLEGLSPKEIEELNNALDILFGPEFKDILLSDYDTEDRIVSDKIIYLSDYRKLK